MQWYSRLYVGKHAKKHRFQIIQDIRASRFQPKAYVITPPASGNNILDIYPSFALLQPYYQNQEQLMILGIANGYWDALDITRQIVDDMYRETGEFDIRKWLALQEEAEKD